MSRRDGAAPSPDVVTHASLINMGRDVTPSRGRSEAWREQSKMWESKVWGKRKIMETEKGLLNGILKT